MTTRSVRIRGRLDLALDLKTGEVVHVQGLRPQNIVWKRTPPGVADELTVTLDSNELPFPKHVLRGLDVQHWVFTHETAEACKPGDVGSFAGKVQRYQENRNSGEITLECVDYTIVPASTDLTEAVAESIDFENPLEEIVRALLQYVPGGDSWDVISFGQLSDKTVGEALADEKPWVTKRRKARPETYGKGVAVKTLRLNSVADLVATGLESSPDFDPLNQVLGTPQIGEKYVFATVYQKRVTRKAVPAKVIKTKGRLRYQAVFGKETNNVWDAIVNMCARMAVLPEVVVMSTGKIAVALVDAAEYQTAKVYRKFEREDQDGARFWRKLTWGATLADLNEDRRFFNEAPPDFVVIVSADPDTGEVWREGYGREEDGKTAAESGDAAGRGATFTVNGVRDRDQMKQLARSTWLALARGEFRLMASTHDPWSDGGDATDADLLGLGAGAALQIAFANFDKTKARPIDVLVARGLPYDVAAKIAAAMEDYTESLIFHVAQVEHSISHADDGEYECAIELRRFLNDGLEPGEIEVDDL